MFIMLPVWRIKIVKRDCSTLGRRKHKTCRLQTNLHISCAEQLLRKCPDHTILFTMVFRCEVVTVASPMNLQNDCEAAVFIVSGMYFKC